MITLTCLKQRETSTQVSSNACLLFPSKNVLSWVFPEIMRPRTLPCGEYIFGGKSKRSGVLAVPLADYIYRFWSLSSICRQNQSLAVLGQFHRRVFFDSLKMQVISRFLTFFRTQRYYIFNKFLYYRLCSAKYMYCTFLKCIWTVFSRIYQNIHTRFSGPRLSHEFMKEK